MSISDGIISCWDAGGKRSYPGTGTTWYDVVGGANGTITNNGGDTIDFVDEKGGYLDFDGTDDYVACSQPNYDTTGDWSWCMWLNRITPGNASGTNVLLGYGQSGGTRVFWYSSGSDVKMGFYSQDGRVAINSNPTVTTRFPANEWSMFALKREGNTAYFCINADEWTELSKNWASHEFIWRDIGKGSSYYGHGYIASVHIYNRGISLDEAKQLYYMQKSRFED